MREDEKVPARIPDQYHVVLLSSEGKTFDSLSFSRWLEDRRQEGRDLCFVVGRPKGLELDRCDLKLSLDPDDPPAPARSRGPARADHRAHKILAGEPYHY